MSGVRVDRVPDAPAFMREHPAETLAALRRFRCPLDGSLLEWLPEWQPEEVETPPVMRCALDLGHGWWQTNGVQMAWYASMRRPASDLALQRFGWLGWEQQLPGYPTPGPGADTLALARELARRIEAGE